MDLKYLNRSYNRTNEVAVLLNYHWQVDVWGPGTNWYDIKRLRRSAFRPSQEDDVVEIHIIWGLKNQDRSSCHFTDFKCRGRTVFDTSFDLNPGDCQVALLVSNLSVRPLGHEHILTLLEVGNHSFSLFIWIVIHSLVQFSFRPSIRSFIYPSTLYLPIQLR